MYKCLFVARVKLIMTSSRSEGLRLVYLHDVKVDLASEKKSLKTSTEISILCDSKTKRDWKFSKG